ncbi:MAG: NADH-quinone oxidoreductase subunit NuoG [Syntrophobacteraceae bacterium]|jgi:NADH-quinone oxidoreductase subunit G|nr:NADH-quinone oxidoreductase subunit NuoG [Syntrophobacteraceae bacterium]
MPRLIIDDLEIDVPAGTKVIDAAEMLGIMIPRFCFHEALGSVGACRMCAVKLLDGPVKGIQMSCMVDALDGMVVSTTDEEAVAFRRFVIECLMLNHPHDCPVCDEGGQCLLQDETVSGGHGMRKYLGKKRTYRDQFLGPFIAHEMNRCIHCYRCARFYQEFAGYRDLGVMQIGSRVFFGRHGDGALESPFAGNLVDLCPTGVYTDKAARYRVRHWDLERAPSVCIHCSLGCSTVANARYREVLRVEAGLNRAVNGYFICDRGRFGYGYSSHPSRPRQARAAGKGLPVGKVLEWAAGQLKTIMHDSGPQAVAAVGSARASLETLATLKTLSRALGWKAPVFFADDTQAEATRRAVSRLDRRLAVSMKDIESADVVLAVGVDPVQEAPMLALAMRQACRKGAAVGVLDPRPVSLPFAFRHIPAPPWRMEAVLNALLDSDGAGPQSEGPDSPPSAWREDMAFLRERLGNSRRPVVVCSTSVAPRGIPDSAAEAALKLAGAGKGAGLFFVLPGPNSFGAAWLGRGMASSFAETLGAIEEGSLKALMVAEADLFRDFPDRPRLDRALQKLQLLMVLDYLPTETVWRSHAFVPTTTVFECDAAFANQEGRIQKTFAVHAPGMPIRQETGGGHPVREFRAEIPGGDPAPAWRLLGDLHDALSPEGAPLMNPWKVLQTEFPGLPSSLEHDAHADGWQVAFDSPEAAEAMDLPGAGEPTSDIPAPAADQFLLLLVDWTFGTEELSGYSPFLRKTEPKPVLWMHAADAAEMGFAEGDSLEIATEDGPVTATLNVSRKMARSVLVLPRHMQVDWHKLRGGRRLLLRGDVREAG